VAAGAAPEMTSAGARLTSRELFDLAKTYFVYDPTDAANTGHMARRLGRLTGVVCVEIPPRDPSPLGALALGILERLGKDLDREKQITQRDAWRLARVWLNAEEIQALIVIGADQLDIDTWHGLADVCRQMPTPSVILIQHQPGRERTERELRVREGAFRSAEPAAFHAWGEGFKTACERAATHDADAERAERPRFPMVPDDDIPYFRAACRAALSKPDLRVVDIAYRKGFDSTSRWLQGRQRVNEEEVGALLATQVSWVRDVNEQLTRLRGAQVAFLRHWWLVKVDPEALAAAHGVDPLIDLDNNEVYDQLRKYAHPKISALAALSIATRLPPGRLAMLNADQAFTDRPLSLSSSYNHIYLGDEMLWIPAASLFLRAHHLDRHMREQPIDGPLFTTSSGERLSAAGVQQQLRAVSRDIGLPLVAGWSASPAQQHSHWMHRRGLTVQAL